MNAELVLPLERVTIAEKMDVIYAIMDDLSRNIFGDANGRLACRDVEKADGEVQER